MISFFDSLVVAGMFFLRIGVPLLVVAALAYGLKRLDRRWEAEARATRAAEFTAQPTVQPQPARPAAPKPGTTIRVPAQQPQLPWIPPKTPAYQVLQPGMRAAPLAQPCWEAKGCSESQKASCAAPGQPNSPCWQARFDAEGAIPEDCVKCEQFQRYPKM